MASASIHVEVAYATPREQIVLPLLVVKETTLGEAVEQSGIRKKFPDMVIDPSGVGIYGQKVTLDYVLQEGDRIEIYRPLVVDPKEVRREKAKKA